jgi:hypothetical protein
MDRILMKEQKEILAMCRPDAERKADDRLLFVRLGRDMFKGDFRILDKYFRNEEGRRCYYANLLAFPKGTSLYAVKKQLRKDFGKEVSLAGYRYDPRHYMFADCYLQEDYEENLYRCQTDEEKEAELDAERKAPIQPIDLDAAERLYAVLFKAIKARLAMILDLEDVPGILNNAYDCYYKGVSCGPSNAAMRAKIARIRALLEDEETVRWLKTKPTDLMFDRLDYVSTYQRMLRSLTDVRDEPLECCRDLLENPEDLWIEDIIANDSPEFESYAENELGEDEGDCLD